MGIGHKASKQINVSRYKQLSFTKTNWQHHHRHGGILRNKRIGRSTRPLATKSPLHVVFKADKKTCDVD